MPILSITDLVELEQFGQIDVTATNDPAFQLYINAAQALCERWCGQPFDRTVHTAEVYDGKRDRHLFLKQKPVEVVTTVVEDGTTLVEDTDYLVYLDRGQLTRLAGSAWREWYWTHKRQAIEVTYTAGYEAGQLYEPPKDLQWVVATVALRLYKAEAAWASTPAGSAGPRTGISLDGVGSQTFASGDSSGGQGSQVQAGSAPKLTTAERSALSPYRIRHFGGGWSRGL